MMGLPVFLKRGLPGPVSGLPVTLHPALRSMGHYGGPLDRRFRSYASFYKFAVLPGPVAGLLVILHPAPSFLTLRSLGNSGI